MITENLPPGFSLGGPESSIETAPDGSGMRIVRVFYLFPAGGQVAPGNKVAAFVAGFSTLAGRNAFLDSMIPDTMTAEVEQAGGQQIVRLHDSSSDLRMWVSGPFLLAVQSGLGPGAGGRNAWVDTFTERYIVLYPARAEGTIPALSPTPTAFDWLIALPFIPAPDFTPPVITTGLPEGFQANVNGGAGETSSTDVPGGHSMRTTGVQYTRPAADGTSKPDEVDILIYGFSDPAARNFWVYALGKGEKPDEDAKWGYAEVGGERVASLTSSYFEAYVWIAGPYLLMTAGRLDPNSGGGNQWVIPFAEMYLKLYPPRADLAFPSPTPSPTGWLNGAPFQPVPEGVPVTVADDLPEGFNVSAIQPIDETDLDGYTTRGVAVEYVRLQVTPEGPVAFKVDVIIVGYSDKAERDEQLRNMSAEGLACEFVMVGGQRVVGCFASPLSYRTWISGPYLVAVADMNSESIAGNPWLDQFAGKYLALYPSQ